jgi:hypothetical protein
VNKNKLANGAAKALADLIRTRPAGQKQLTISLEGNRIGDAGLQQLACAVEDNGSASFTIRMQGNPITQSLASFDSFRVLASFELQEPPKT